MFFCQGTCVPSLDALYTIETATCHKSNTAVRRCQQTAETQSGLPLLPWSCYASVIQCDIIQYLLFLFYYNTGIISFLAIYNDTIL